MNDVSFPVAKVLEGIAAAAEARLTPIKINAVIKRSENLGAILPLARHFKGSGHLMRFIEFMDVGATNGWRMDEVVPSAEVLDLIHRELPIEPIEPSYPGEVAQRWRYLDGSGEVGVVSSVTQAFCRTCTRARLSTEGMLYTCLFACAGHDLRALLRGGGSDEALAATIGHIWRERSDRYSEMRNSATPTPGRIEMSYIGG
jgi:cyclic pyranopterin phosphate synthase